MKAKGIPPEERVAAAKWFAISNMAATSLIPRGERDIHLAYAYVNAVILSETGVSMQEEYESWLKDVQRSTPGDYLSSEWNKTRRNWNL